MATICPTVTAKDAHQYRQQMERVAPFAQRVHVDFADGVFAPIRLINPIQAWWPEVMQVDLHLMLERPLKHLETVISLKPDLIIAHAEAKGGFHQFARELNGLGIKIGVALLQTTPVAAIEPALEFIDHVLVFSGDLGYFGGQADLSLLEKVQLLKRLKPRLEIGWDGGINDHNAAQLAAGGVDVLNVGGFIQNASDSHKAYQQLVQAVQAVS